MKIERFEDIIAWQKAKEICVMIYKSFSELRDFRFRDQIQSASVSVMNNIAEGFERRTNNELRQFLYMAKGSCGELRSMLILANDLKLLKKQEYTDLKNRAEEISRLLSGFIKTLNAK
jgi:four helix bundle protein